MDYKKLSDLCDVVSGGTPARSRIECWENGTIPWVKISDLSSKYIKGTEEKITETGLKESSAKLLPRGTILFSIFATLGATGILDIDASTNQAIAGLTVRDSRTIDPEYIYYYLLSKKTYVNNIGRGVAQNNINLSILKSLEVPVPTVDEQRSIIAILNKNDAIITGKRKVLKALNELVKARFVEMFGDPISNDKGWNTDPLTAVCSRIYGGGTPSKSHPEYFEGSIPWVSPKDMKSDVITDSIDHITEEAIANSTTNLVPEGSVLMVIRSGILKHDLPVSINAVPVTINQDMKAFVPGENITASFLRNYFKAIELDVLAGVRGVTADNIDFKTFQQRKIIVPPIHLQEEFEDFCRQVDKSKVAVQKSLDETQLLFNSLMQKYFG
ncbi:restriction endonuclease subunit S [Galactobacillus timonensis]|uniref:restriction endonuclease subunit S n=1 Tax=Galactobacillus timonensis TaxID=2041840 RepID=UPI0010846A61|nr:restriction endonuclease subunit S [Galactobacillus timonensis]